MPIFVGNTVDITSVADEMDWPIDVFRVVPVDTETKAAEAGVALARGGEVGALDRRAMFILTLCCELFWIQLAGFAQTAD